MRPYRRDEGRRLASTARRRTREQAMEFFAAYFTSVTKAARENVELIRRYLGGGSRKATPAAQKP